MLFHRVLLIVTACLFISACSQDYKVGSTSATGFNTVEMQVNRTLKAKKLQLTYAYKEIVLTSQNQKKLLYLFDWQQGVIVNYGKAKAKDEYTALSIGHQRVKQLETYFKRHRIVTITYDPSLPKDSLLIVEYLSPALSAKGP